MQGTFRTSIVVILVCSILESIRTRGRVNSKGHTRGGVNSEVHTRGGVNSDHTVNGVSTEQGTFRTNVVVILVCSILESIRTRGGVNSKGRTRGGVNSKGRTRSGVNSEIHTRGGVNSDHTAIGVSTEQGTFRTNVVVIFVSSILESIHLEVESILKVVLEVELILKFILKVKSIPKFVLEVKLILIILQMEFLQSKVHLEQTL